MPKPKRINKTKEEIVARIKDVEKAKTGRKFVKDVFFPALCESTDSINDADMFLQNFSTMLMETFLHEMKSRKFSEFKLAEKLSKDFPKYEQIQKMVHLFDDMTCKDAQELIEGLKDEIRFFYRKEMGERKIESIKIDWLADEDGNKR